MTATANGIMGRGVAVDRSAFLQTDVVVVTRRDPRRDKC